MTVEITIAVPDALGQELQRVQGRLPEILERGLREVLAEGPPLGSVLGYLAAGVLIGPYGVALIGNAQQVMHFAEFGVVMMLFVIGLELEPPCCGKCVAPS